MKIFKLNNGKEIPAIGLGTWQTPDGETAVKAVSHAIKCGYRHVDAAAVYGSEPSCGVKNITPSTIPTTRRSTPT